MNFLRSLLLSYMVIVLGTTHNCSFRRRGLRANCSSKGLTSVPQDLPKNIRSLNLRDNKLSNLSGGVFKKYKDLVGLNLGMNQLHYLKSDTFEGLNKLKTLALCDNELNSELSFEKNLFLQIQNLLKLDLKNNTKNTSNGRSYPYLGDLGQLNYLILDLVEKPEFDSCGFHRMTKLQTLDLRNCQLKFMMNSSLHDLPRSIQTLILTGCTHVQYAEADFLRPFPKLANIRISDSCIHVSDALHVLYPFEHKTMDSIEFINVNQGLCKGPIIRPDAVIINAKMMQHLQKICLKKLKFINNGIVDFKENSLLFYIYPQCFESITFHINHFSFLNGFKSFELAALVKQMTNLSYFEFSETKMLTKTLSTTRVFQKLNSTITFLFPPRLNYILLSSVSIDNIKYKIHFENISSLRRLDLSYCQLVGFPNISFSGESRIKHLDLSGIPVWVYFNGEMLNGFKEVVTLNLQNADLRHTVKKGYNIFRSFPVAQSIDVSSNLLYFLPPGSFVSNRKLRFLNLNKNLFAKIPLALTELSQLTNLQIEHNVIESINSTFRNWFDLQHKRFGRFQLNLIGNMLKCSCENSDFIRWLYKTKISFDERDMLFCRLQNGSKIRVKDVYLNFHDLFQDCNSEIWLQIGIIMLAAFVSLTIPLALVVNFRWRIALWIYRQFKRAIEKQISTSFKYDVYISCAHDSLKWVKDFLIPKIEMSWKMKICIEERDILPGDTHVDAVISCIHDSRNILFVVTKYFYQREIGILEIHRAKYEKFCRNLQRIIVIALDVEVDQFPSGLSQIINDVTFINWNEEQKENNLEKLKTTLFSTNM